MKYTILQGDKVVLAPVHESAIRSYLTSYAGNLETLTVHSFVPGDVGEDMGLGEGISAIEWLEDNAPHDGIRGYVGAGVEGKPRDPEATRVIEFRDWVKSQLGTQISYTKILDKMNDIWGFI